MPEPSQDTPFHVLVFSKTTGYRHTSIPAALTALQALASRTGKFTIEASEDANATITAPSLNRFAVVILLQNTGDFLDETQLDALRQFLRAGGGVVAIHGAAAGLLDCDWYGELIGAHFANHPDPERGDVLVEAPEHWILRGCCEGEAGRRREGWMDEWYNFTTHPRSNPRLKVLLRGDPKSFSGGQMGDDHPLSWCQEFEGGRVYFTALGHFDEAYSNGWFMDQIYRGILWAAGRGEVEG
ncbi:glycosyl hydrolase [Westerdykella ornata]|uniref:Glycosyl hydrolase n=1 Tax=Westerdykella ornata TaxID=318751 RepID=A0A6A6JXL3_WESOR|nr:glycosyl hydrolase [Westerdykella ornata]KAF2281361.1 glycosyl hydrolase [Westerdykella ornata]